LSLFRPLWGVVREADGPWTIPEAISKIAATKKYAGVEAPIKLAMDFGTKNFVNLLKEHKLRYLPMVFTSGPPAPSFGDSPHRHHPKLGRSVSAHFDVFRAQVDEIMSLGDIVHKITSHTGHDFMRPKEVEELFTKILDFEKKVPVPMHETHRCRVLYSPWLTRDLLPKFPALKLVADLSHWLCVAETNTENEELTATIKEIAKHVWHIHGRVGYDNGPQVSDPRAPEWQSYTEGFERWWSIIFDSQRERGMSVATLSPEHGPPPYQETLPYTRQPVADLWEVNNWVGDRAINNFQKRFSQP